MGGSIPCPLCLGMEFPHLETLFNSLLSMYRQVQVCPDITCDWRGEGLPQLINHISFKHMTSLLCEPTSSNKMDSMSDSKISLSSSIPDSRVPCSSSTVGSRVPLSLSTVDSISSVSISSGDSRASMSFSIVESRAADSTKAHSKHLDPADHQRVKNPKIPANFDPLHQSIIENIFSLEDKPWVQPNQVSSLGSSARSSPVHSITSSPILQYTTKNEPSETSDCIDDIVHEPVSAWRMLCDPPPGQLVTHQPIQPASPRPQMGSPQGVEPAASLPTHLTNLNPTLTSIPDAFKGVSSATISTPGLVPNQNITKRFQSTTSDFKLPNATCKEALSLQPSSLVTNSASVLEASMFSVLSSGTLMDPIVSNGPVPCQEGSLCPAFSPGLSLRSGPCKEASLDPAILSPGASSRSVPCQDESIDTIISPGASNGSAVYQGVSLGPVNFKGAFFGPAQAAQTELVVNSNRGLERGGRGKSKLGRQQSTENQHVECKECGWMFDNLKFLKLHKVLLHTSRQNTQRSGSLEKLSCVHCHTDFLQFEAFEQHMRAVHNDPRHFCRYCTKSFKLRGSLLVHQRVIHHNSHNPTGDKEELSPDSNRPEDNSKMLQGVEDHFVLSKVTAATTAATAATTAAEAKFSIENKTIEQTNSFGTSPDKTNQVPAGVEKGEIVLGSQPLGHRSGSEESCHLCQKTFPDRNQLENHVRYHDESKHWDCNICNKKFTTKYFLKKHTRLHTGETPYSCDLCGKTFAFQQSYHKHMLYHTDEKPYSCTTCGRAFKELSTLQNHERIHSGERPFVCESCGKSFRQRVSYLVHRRIHTGVLPYICDLCGKKFRYKVTQRTHKCPGKVENETVTFESATSQHSKEIVPPNQTTLQQNNPPMSQPALVASAFFPEHSSQTDLTVYRDPTSPTSPKTYSPYVTPEIKQNLLNFRRAQGKRQLGHRLQNILERSRRKSNSLPENVQPISELEHLSLVDPARMVQLNPQEMNLSSLEVLLNNKDDNSVAQTADDAIKDAIENFDISAL